MLLAEGAGPHVVIESISEGMQKSKVPLQQKAALSILLRLVNEFGAFALDLKLLFSYIKSDQCLLNSHVEVKNQAIEVLCVLYKQLGAVVRSLVEQSGISDLLKKSVMDSLDAVAYDPSAAVAYSAVSSAVSSATSNAGGAVAQTASGSAQGVGAVSQGAMKPAIISVNDLIEPQDISGEVKPLLKKLATVEGKEAWKERQQGVLELTALLKQKVRVVNNAAVAEVVSALKQRLGETNLNLRAKVLLCISQLSEALGGEVVRYNATLLPDVLKLSNDSNKNVVEALYTLLTHWVSHDDDRTAAYLNSVLPFCGVALKQSKSRGPFLLWLTPYMPLCESRSLQPILNDLLDCLLDKAKEVRARSNALLPTLCQKCGRIMVEQCYAGRKQADVVSLKAILEPILCDCPDGAQAAKHAPLPAAAPAEATPVEKEGEKSKLTTERKQALANRPGARVLVKRNTIASLKRAAVSSIPKALPPLKQRMRGEHTMNQPLLTVVPEPEPVPEVPEVPEVSEVSEVPEVVAKEDFPAFEKPLAVASVQCEGWCEALETRRDTLLTQRELGLFACSLEERENVGFVGEVMDALWHVLKALEKPCVDLYKEHTSEYNRVVEALSKTCYVLNDVVSWRPCNG